MDIKVNKVRYLQPKEFYCLFLFRELILNNTSNCISLINKENNAGIS